MAGLRHDAHKSREDAKSRTIRAALGIKFPHELEEERHAADAKRLEEARKKAQGAPLFGGEE